MLVIDKTVAVPISHFTFQFASVDVSVAHSLYEDLWAHRSCVLAQFFEFFRAVLILGPAD